MKNVLLIIALLCNFLLPHFCQALVSCFNEDTIRIYKVIDINRTSKKINGTNKFFILLVQDTANKKFFSLVSLKTNLKPSLKIKIGELYAFKLEKYFEYDYFIQLGLKLSICIDGEKVQIPLTQNTTNIYTTKNLHGLYYISPPDDQIYK